jgi:hypothetical protein
MTRSMWYDIKYVPAPMNTPVLLWDGTEIIHAVQWDSLGPINGTWFQMGDGDGREVSTPTHWRRMPLPPTEEV